MNGGDPTPVYHRDRRDEPHRESEREDREHHEAWATRLTARVPTGFRSPGVIAERLTGLEPNPRHEQLDRSGRKAPHSSTLIPWSGSPRERRES